MENLRLDPNRILANEILSFEGVELERTIGNKHSFETSGTLNVLYFKDYSLFILYLNNWKYALLDTLPIIKATNSYIDPVIYILPIDDGFFTLKFTKVHHIEAIQNLEIIFGRNSNFKGSHEAQLLLRGDFPGHFSREDLYGLREGSGRMSFRSTESILGDLELRKSDIIKRELSNAIGKLRYELLEKSKRNINLTRLREYESLINTREEDAPIHFILRTEVQDELMKGRRLIRRVEEEDPFITEGATERKSFFGTLRKSLENLKDDFIQRKSATPEKKLIEGSTLSNIKERLKSVVTSIEGDKHGDEGQDKVRFESHLPSDIVEKVKGKSPGRFSQREETSEEPYPRLSVAEKIKSKIPNIFTCSGETRTDSLIIDSSERRRTSYRSNEGVEIRNSPSLLDRVREKLPDVFIQHREPFRDRTNEMDLNAENQEPQHTFQDKIRNSFREAKNQVTGCVNTVSQNERVHTLVVQVKEGCRGIQQKLDLNRGGMEESEVNRPPIEALEGIIHADSVSSWGDYGMEPATVDPMLVRTNFEDKENNPSLLDRIKSQIPVIKEKLHLIDHSQQQQPIPYHDRYLQREQQQQQYTGNEGYLSGNYEPGLSYGYQDQNMLRQGQEDYYPGESNLRQYSTGGQEFRSDYQNYPSARFNPRVSSSNRNEQTLMNENRGSARDFAGFLYSEG